MFIAMDERGPVDDLCLQCEAAQRLDPDEKQSPQDRHRGVITRHEVRRLAATT